MTDPSHTPGAHHRRPLGTIGLTVATVLVIPTLLFYAVAPDEPLKKDVAVFAKERHRAYFADPLAYRALGYERFCILEADDPLTIVQNPSERPDGSLLARAQGQGRAELPFCPAGAEVVLRPHQVRQKDDVVSQITNRLSRLLAP